MNKLTPKEIEAYAIERNTATGVDGIPKERLQKIDLDDIREIVHKGDKIESLDGKLLFKRDSFTPRAGSIYLKPSFAGRQIIMGKTGRQIHFSNGRWFAIAYLTNNNEVKR